MCHLSHYTRLIMGIALLVVQGTVTSNLYGQPADSSVVPPDAPFGQHVLITMESYKFSPSEVVVEVDKPVTVTLSNQSFLVPHNFLLDDPSGNRIVEADIASGDMQVITLILTEPGIYPYYCDKKLLFFPKHREKGMEGHLLVR